MATLRLASQVCKKTALLLTQEEHPATRKRSPGHAAGERGHVEKTGTPVDRLCRHSRHGSEAILDVPAPVKLPEPLPYKPELNHPC